MYLFRRSFTQTDISNFEGNIWFSLVPEYGMDTYGSYVSMYYLHEKSKLLDIGKINNRRLLMKLFKQKFPNSNLDPEEILDPDNQYSGGQGNKIAHNLIKSVIGDYFDGTIINELYVDNAELAGATEVVLWNFQNLTQVNSFN